MGLQPKIPLEQKTRFQKCSHCNELLGSDSFIKSKSFFFPNGNIPICNDCIKKYLVENQFDWSCVDRLCQYIDIPFVPAEFEKLHAANGEDVFPVYAAVFLQGDYEGLGWGEYFQEFKKLEEQGFIRNELPLIQDDNRRKLQEKWGFNYDDEALLYLENLYKGLLLTQNVSGALQGDQALKLCKISYEIDSRIREGGEIDKMLASYDKLVKIAEFTPKNTKNANDFDSMGELIKWLEKKGFKNKFYDNVTRDIVDETIKNIQSYNQRLYTNESGIGDEISSRLDSLKIAKEMESYYDMEKEYDLDEFENAGYEELFYKEDFKTEIEGDTI